LIEDHDASLPDDEDTEPVGTVNLSDPKSVKKSRDRARREEQEEASFWRAVLNDRIGRRVMWNLLVNECGGFSPTFQCGPNGFPQPDATWFAAGKYAVGQILYQRWMRLAREGLTQMMDENHPSFVATKRTRRSSQ
jgi:hypothetical protein